MQPELDLGPLELQTFGICLALAFIACGALLARRFAELGRPADWAYEALFAAVVGGLIGARVDYLIQNWERVSDDLVGALFSGSGLVFFGGLAGGALGVALWARWRGFLGLALADAAAPTLALGYAIGRVGCQISGDGDYGVASDLPWAMAYPEGAVPTTEVVHPTPVYETLAMGVATLVLWRLRDRVRPGMLMALYLLLAGVERLLVEFIRRNDAVLAGLTVPQLVSVAMIAAALGWIALAGGIRGEQHLEGRSA
jgi:phosphatidylglycerol:prolipoprotein diacylglycerol transferase